MSETKKSEKTTIGYEAIYLEPNKLKLIEGRYALSKEELDKLDNMIITVGGTYKIEKDPSTGKISRIQDGKTLSQMTDAKYERILKEAKRKEQKEQGR